jgi:hypothetical protein
LQPNVTRSGSRMCGDSGVYSECRWNADRHINDWKFRSERAIRDRTERERRWCRCFHTYGERRKFSDDDCDQRTAYHLPSDCDTIEWLHRIYRADVYANHCGQVRELFSSVTFVDSEQRRYQYNGNSQHRERCRESRQRELCGVVAISSSCDVAAQALVTWIAAAMRMRWPQLLRQKRNPYCDRHRRKHGRDDTGGDISVSGHCQLDQRNADKLNGDTQPYRAVTA